MPSVRARRFAPLALVPAALVACVLGAATAAPAASVTAATTTVTVTATDFHFKLSRTSVPKGKVLFKLVNKGQVAHNFRILGHATRLTSPGKTTTMSITFTRAGSFAYLCTVPGHAAAGMKGKLKVT